MPYFTYRSGSDRATWRAVYNGRFAFVAGLTPQDGLRVDLEEPGRSPPDVVARPGVIKSLSEESLHRRFFLQCRSGCLLNGLRLFVRLAWLFARSDGPVVRYYRLRTDFFNTMYALHEARVEAHACGGDAGRKASDALDAQIDQADRALIGQWSRDLSVVGRPWSRAFLVVVGRALAQHFSVVTADVTVPGRTATNVATGGWLNTSGSFGLRRGRLSERLLARLRPESFVALSLNDDWHWMRLKFQTERAVPVALCPGPEVETYDTYVKRLLSFLSLYLGIKDQTNLFRLQAALLDPDTLPLEPPEWADSAEMRSVVGFFYGHGN